MLLQCFVPHSVENGLKFLLLQKLKIGENVIMIKAGPMEGL